jgi:hypothetical protein
MNSTRLNRKREKEEILRDFQEQNKDLPKQGTKEWEEKRLLEIGGSEMGIITKKNRYSSLEDLIARKVGLTKFSGNLCTRFGNLFEPVTTCFLNSVLDLVGKINDDWPSLSGMLDFQSYSPDGIALMRLRLLKKSEDGEGTVREYVIVLFEYKSPFSRIPNGKIPEDYLDQLNTGLCSIPIADIGIFVDSLYRKCSIKEFHYNLGYDRIFHNKDSENPAFESLPLAMGVIVFYISNGNKEELYSYCQMNREYLYERAINKNNIVDISSICERNKLDYRFVEQIEFDNMNLYESIVYILNSWKRYKERKGRKKIKKGSENNIYEEKCDFSEQSHLYLIDLGSVHQHRSFDKLLSISVRKKNRLINLYYISPCIVTNEIEKNKFLISQEIIVEKKSEEQMEEDLNDFLHKRVTKVLRRILNKGGTPIGILPWKLFKSEIILQEREEYYMEEHKDEVESAISILHDIKKDLPEGREEEEIKKRFKNYFPDKYDRIIKKREGSNNIIYDNDIDREIKELIPEGLH